MLIMRLAEPLGVHTNTTNLASSHPAVISRGSPAIVKTVVWARQVQASKNLSGPAHVQVPRFQRAQALGWIAGDAHELSVATFNVRVKTQRQLRNAC